MLYNQTDLGLAHIFTALVDVGKCLVLAILCKQIEILPIFKVTLEAHNVRANFSDTQMQIDLYFTHHLLLKVELLQVPLRDYLHRKFQPFNLKSLTLAANHIHLCELQSLAVAIFADKLSLFVNTIRFRVARHRVINCLRNQCANCLLAQVLVRILLVRLLEFKYGLITRYPGKLLTALALE